MIRCAVCGKACEPARHHFPTRPAPHNRPFVRALYFSDPFFGGTDQDFCSAKCSASRATRREKTADPAA